jgi:ABC-type amino acid transport substrate-binding protein
LKRSLIIFFLITLHFFCFAQEKDTLVINYFPRSPFAIEENGQLLGIEVEIMNEYILWLKAKKKLNVNFRYVAHDDFDTFYNSTRDGKKNSIGLGAVTIGAEKAKEVSFTAPYLKSVAFCITNGNALDVKNKTTEDIVKALGSMNALTMENTVLCRYVNQIKKQYIQDLKIKYQPDEIKILDEISRNVLSFGYVNAISFWFYVKSNPSKFLKMQRVLSQSTEELGFVLPKNSPQKALFDEFFSGPAGFKSSPTYKTILERYLGSYMAQNVSIN